MAERRGGYRKPRNPAPVSGPGQMSRRTDGGPIDGQPVQDVGGFEYGGRKEFRELQGAAPMNESGVSTAPVQFTPLSAASTRPDEPVTAGAPMGPGPNSLPSEESGSLADALAALRTSTRSAETLAELAFRLGV